MLFLLFVSCDGGRGGLDDDDIDEETIKETSEADGFYNHIFDLVNQEVDEAESVEFPAKTNKTSEVDPCAEVTYYLSANNEYIENLTIAYTDENCLTNGRTRIGKIHVHLTGRLSDIGTVTTVTLEDFFIDGYQIEGTQVSKNESFDFTSYQWTVSQEVSHGKVTHSTSSDFLTWESEKEIVLHLLDDKVIYTGSGEGISSSGDEFEMNITTPLEYKGSCGYVVSGVYTLEVGDYYTQVVDYGDGSCDNSATVTANGQMLVFTIQ